MKTPIKWAAVPAAVIAVAVLAGVEGYRPHPYQDITGVWTDCYGETEGVNPVRIRDKAECDFLLSEKAKRLEADIRKALKQPADNLRVASYISFAYNVGFSAFKNSTLLRKHNSGDYDGACAELYRWVYVKKVYVQGLYNRRKVEYNLCMGVPPNVEPDRFNRWRS